MPLILIIILILGAGAMGAPTTKPTTNPAYLPGWIDAGGKVDYPPAVQIPLDPLIKAAKPGQVLNLPTGTYVTGGTLIIPQAGLKVFFNGSTITGPATGAWFVPTGAHITFDGFVIPKGPMIFNPQGDWFTIDNCKIGIGSPAGSVLQAVKTGPHGTNCAVNNSHIGQCTTVSFYGDRGGESATNTIFEPSVREYDLRLESPNGITVPDGGCFTGCTFIANSGPNSKDAVGVRMHTNVRFAKCRFVNNDIRWGQANKPPTTKPGDFASGSMENCTFDGIKGRSAIANLQGSEITVTGCIFNFPTDPLIAADSQSMTTYGNNVQNILAGEQSQKFFTSPHGGASNYTGGNIVNVVPK